MLRVAFVILLAGQVGAAEDARQSAREALVSQLPTVRTETVLPEATERGPEPGGRRRRQDDSRQRDRDQRGRDEHEGDHDGRREQHEGDRHDQRELGEHGGIGEQGLENSSRNHERGSGHGDESDHSNDEHDEGHH